MEVSTNSVREVRGRGREGEDGCEELLLLFFFWGGGGGGGGGDKTLVGNTTYHSIMIGLVEA